MRFVRLVARSDEYDSTPGFMLKDMPSYEGAMADRDGSLTAHDLLEHQNGARNIGPAWDELEAIGGVWYVRGQWGDLLQRRPDIHSPQYNLASDVVNTFATWLDDAMYDGPNQHREGVKPHDYDEDFREIIDLARPTILDEWDELEYGTLDVYCETALRRMRNGFNKAKRRFERSHNRYFAADQFRAVRDAVARATRWIDWEGQEFVLGYGDGEAKVRPVEEYGYD